MRSFLLTTALSIITGTAAFTTTSSSSRVACRSSSRLNLGKEGNVEFGGNTWKPKSETMGSTDVGDYFPDDYDKNEVAFSEGMGGSQSVGGGGERGPALPGMENLGADAVMMGGIELAEGIPADMDFVMSSVPDGEVAMDVASNSKGAELLLSVKPVCMGFEDYFAAFTKDSHPSFSLRNDDAVGRMDRRGGEPTELTVSCTPGGQAGEWVGNLVINLPEDNSKICYKITAKSF